METMQVTIVGVCPLLLHAGRLSDPLDPATKALKAATAKRQKSDENHEEIARLEWMGGMNTDDDGYPALTAEAFMASLRDGAKKTKRGKKVVSSVFVLDDARLSVGVNKKAADLYEVGGRFVDRRAVKVGTSRVMRTRPRFDKWQATFSVSFNPDLIDREEVLQAIDDAGQQVGIGDFRPRFGRYERAGKTFQG